MHLSRQYKNKLHHFFSGKPKKGYLFGSDARNEAKNNSDIDIHVVDHARPICMKFFGFQAGLEDAKVDPDERRP